MMIKIKIKNTCSKSNRHRYSQIHHYTVRSFTGMGRNYRNGLPEWTLICAIEYFLCVLLGQSGLELPQKAISPRNIQFMYPKIWLRTLER